MSNERRYALLKHTHTSDEIEGGGGGGGTVASVTADEVNLTVDNSDPANPVVSMYDMPEGTVKGRADGAGTGQPSNLDRDDLYALLSFGAMSEVRGASFVGFGTTVATGVEDVALTIKNDCTIKKVVVLTTGGSGSCVIDIWKDAYASYPPTVLDSICGSSKPTISGGTTYQDSTLSGWTTALSEGDTLKFHVESTTSFTSIFIFLILENVGSTAADGYTDERVREIIAEEFANGAVTVVGSTYTVNLIAGDYANLRLHDLCSNPSGVVTVNFTLPAGTIISSKSTASPALDTSGFTSGSTLNFVNLGSVLGKGGRGGRGAAAGNTFGEDGGSGRRGISGHGARAGQNGGNAIKGPGSGVTLNITNAAGYIFGGGGGGGGGGASLDFNGDTNLAAGGGGGAGAGSDEPGEGGTAIAANTTVPATAAGADGTPGGVDRTGTNGTGGAKADNGSGLGGAGGDGGTWGAAGSAGTSPTTFDRDYAGGAAGTAGKAIDVNSGTIVFVSGNDATHVKGAVS